MFFYAFCTHHHNKAPTITISTRHAPLHQPLPQAPVILAKAGIQNSYFLTATSKDKGKKDKDKKALDPRIREGDEY